MIEAHPPCEVRLEEKSNDPRKPNVKRWFRYMTNDWQRPVDEQHELPYITEGSLVGQAILGKERGHVFEIERPDGTRRLRIEDIRRYAPPKRGRYARKT